MLTLVLQLGVCDGSMGTRVGTAAEQAGVGAREKVKMHSAPQRSGGASMLLVPR